ncbi:sensor histidine kinase NtrY-like [Candidatus Nucleicultrix amoebiphila]|uniref:sensor histidine kinase NtrY-like n=1 Tax=Candidatus Nucleicultrix amoebiphila TaxID=1509244 RepID=UPI000A26E0AC|nr:PAS domain-containing sensor histidine kinase [Candidatus Nucleicultrix amoebiphila]
MSASLNQQAYSLYERLLKWMHRINFSRKFSYGIVFLAVVAGIATYIAFSNPELVFGSSKFTIILLNIDLAILLLLGIVIARRLVKVWVERREGQAGAKLHVRLVVIFSLLTALPTILVALFSAVFFNVGVQSWFSHRVKTALDESSAVATAYLEEHRKVISANVHAMANDIGQQFSSLENNQDVFNRFLDLQVDVRNLNEAIVFNSSSKVLARSRLAFALEFEPINQLDLTRATHGVVIHTNDRGDRVRALIRIDPAIDSYLLVGRLVDSKVLSRIKMVKSAVGEYQLAESKLSDIELKFSLIFIVVSFLLLFIVVWVVLLFANRLVRPIRGLIAAVEKVRGGDLSARVVEPIDDDEFALLSQEFNRMTQRLQAQQKKLIEANKQLDARRQIMEDVLAGVTAGVMGLSSDRIIRFTNRSAAELLNISIEKLIGQKIDKAIPEMAPLVKKAEGISEKFLQSQLSIQRLGFQRVFLMRIVLEEEESGYIVTFDDITQLVSAQRTAAWADVARHIAHEIKNPLTPIQLSAERLRRKYKKELSENDTIFDTCIDTIIRQVDHIGRLVGEFSAFARMPSPEIHDENIIELAKQALFLQQSAHTNVDFIFNIPEKPLMFPCDASQITQVLTNLLQNAVDSVESYHEKSGGGTAQPMVKLTIEQKMEKLHIIVEDNGEGFPEEGRDKLTEPYMTTKGKGTGLGLAIVKKIVEDHKGSLILEDRKGGGARVRLTFNYDEGQK